MPELLRRFLRPREGWTSMALLIVMLATLVWSLQRAEWVDHMDYLLPRRGRGRAGSGRCSA